MKILDKTPWECIDKARNSAALDVSLPFYMLRADYDNV